MSATLKIFLSSIVVIIILLVVLAIGGQLNFINYRSSDIDTQLSLQEMWDNNEFLAIVTSTQTELMDAPLHPNYLFYNGLSHYYLASVSEEREERDYHIQQSITSLRKLLLTQQPPQLQNIYFTLGKAYYHKGPLYYNESIHYITEALALGLSNNEAYQYLGITHAHLEEYEQSIEYLTRAILEEASFPLQYLLAEIYVIDNQIAEAERIYQTLQNDVSADQKLQQEQQLRILQARILTARQEYTEAQRVLEEMITEYPNIADVYFQLGEVHAALNEIDKARFNWRAALKIDPFHAEALRQLQN